MNTHRLTADNFHEEGCPTTRRHPRTLADAFTDERASWFEEPEPRGYPGLWWALVLGCGAAGLMLTLWGPA